MCLFTEALKSCGHGSAFIRFFMSQIIILDGTHGLCEGEYWVGSEWLNFNEIHPLWWGLKQHHTSKKIGVMDRSKGCHGRPLPSVPMAARVDGVRAWEVQLMNVSRTNVGDEGASARVETKTLETVAILYGNISMVENSPYLLLIIYWLFLI